MTLDFSTHCTTPALSRGIAVSILLTLSANSSAEVSFDLNGFGSLGLSRASNNNISYPAAGISDSWNENGDTKIAIQGSVVSTNGLSGAIQVISRGREDYQPKTEWLYGAYNVKPNLTLRLGRMRTPLYEFSGYLDLGISYPWVRPPMTVYASDTMASRYDGIDLQFTEHVGSWDASLQASFGHSKGRSTISEDAKNQKFSLKNIMGVVLRAERGVWGVRLGRLQSDDMDIEVPEFDMLAGGLSAAGFDEIANYIKIKDDKVRYTTVGISMDHEYWVMNSEVIHVSIPETIIPSITFKYIMIGRHIGDFTLHYTYARKDMNIPSGTADPIYGAAAQLQMAGASEQQIAGLNAMADGVTQVERSFDYKVSSNTLGLRYAATDMIALKAELQHSTNQDNQSTNFTSLSLDFLF